VTPTQKLKQYVLFKLTEKTVPPAEVDAAYDRLDDDPDMDGWRDVLAEVRPGQHETGLPVPYSRHYESQAVASRMLDGSYVGWTYWYGGGKHGEPDSMPWMEDAYEVEARDEVRTVKVFSRKSQEG